MLKPGDRRNLVSEINVTPFVDVMLVLLIIFMVTAPMMTQGVDVDLPETESVESLPTDNENMILSLQADGTIYLDEYKVPIDELEAKVAADPNDCQARFDLAEAQSAAGDFKGAVDNLLHIVRADREWNDQAARKQLLTIFEAAGLTSDVSRDGRRRLSSILFS